MKNLDDADVAIVQSLTQKYGRAAVIRAASQKAEKLEAGRPRNPSHNCAAVWAFVEFIKNFRVEESTKKFDHAVGHAARILAEVMPREEPFTEDALRNLYFEAKRRAKTEPAIATLMHRDYEDRRRSKLPPNAVAVPILARVKGGKWVTPWIDREKLDNPDFPEFRIISL
jgi:hypothetical protein